jgi:hypothetical protein
LDCIKAFAQTLSINDFSRIAFIDDKPENFVPVAPTPIRIPGLRFVTPGMTDLLLLQMANLNIEFKFFSHKRFILAWPSLYT